MRRDPVSARKALKVAGFSQIHIKSSVHPPRYPHRLHPTPTSCSISRSQAFSPRFPIALLLHTRTAHQKHHPPLSCLRWGQRVKKNDHLRRYSNFQRPAARTARPFPASLILRSRHLTSQTPQIYIPGSTTRRILCSKRHLLSWTVIPCRIHHAKCRNGCQDRKGVSGGHLQ